MVTSPVPRYVEWLSLCIFINTTSWWHHHCAMWSDFPCVYLWIQRHGDITSALCGVTFLLYMKLFLGVFTLATLTLTTPMIYSHFRRMFFATFFITFLGFTSGIPNIKWICRVTCDKRNQNTTININFSLEISAESKATVTDCVIQWKLFNFA